MALSQTYNQPLYEAAAQLKHTVLGASVTIYGGTLAVNDAGVAKVFTQALIAGGATLLGYPVVTYANSTGSDATMPPMMFRRKCPMVIAGKSDDLPTLASVGGTVYLHDNFTVKATDAGGNVAVTLLEVLPNFYCKVLLP